MAIEMTSRGQFHEELLTAGFAVIQSHMFINTNDSCGSRGGGGGGMRSFTK